MSEPRKNRLSIDGAQVKDDENVATYKPIPESEPEFRTSKSSLAKSKEKISPDGAEEKLLQKEEEARIVTRVDMADAKYVVGDHRNGDAKIELDANKRQFSGLTKEELLKYADDPFWVNLRWSLFVLFWAAWLGMLAGAIVIIVQAPKCAPPTPRTWFENGPLVEFEDAGIEEAEAALPLLQDSGVQGIFVEVPTYKVLDDPDLTKKFKELVTMAKNVGVKVIVDLTPNFVPIEHPWFRLSANRTEPYTDYFTWAKSTEFDASGVLQPPNQWVSHNNTSAWTYNKQRDEFYLHQYGENQPDLNFYNERVLEQFNNTIKTWMQIGASGIRLNKVQDLAVNASAAPPVPLWGRGADPSADHTQRAFWRRPSAEAKRLRTLLAAWGQLVATATATATDDTVFTINEEGDQKELFRGADGNDTVPVLRPAAAAPLPARRPAGALAANLTARLGNWPALQLQAEDADAELAAFALLLPAAPILTLQQLKVADNTTTNESLGHLVALRSDATLAHGQHAVAAIPAANQSEPLLIACARWKKGHTGYVAVHNPTEEELRANLTALANVPATLTVHHVSRATRLATGYTTNHVEQADNVLVPSRATVVLSYVPRTEAVQ